MRVVEIRSLPAGYAQVLVQDQYQIPFFSYYIQASFPSPAENFLERVCDVNDLCISNSDETYLLLMNDDGLLDDRIEQGDTIIFDRSRPITAGKLVVARLNEDSLVRQIQYVERMKVLLPLNSAFDPVYIHPGDDFEVFGVVTFVIRSANPADKHRSTKECIIEPVANLNQRFIQNQEATYFGRVGSNSMLGDGIDRGDIIIFDSSKIATPRSIVVAWLNNEYALKRIGGQKKKLALHSSNQSYQPIPVRSGDELRVVGVVTYVIQKK
jgi:DNA polymerase V